MDLTVWTQDETADGGENRPQPPFRSGRRSTPGCTAK